MAKPSTHIKVYRISGQKMVLACYLPVIMVGVSMTLFKTVGGKVYHELIPVTKSVIGSEFRHYVLKNDADDLLI